MLAAGVPAWSVDALLDLQRLYQEGGASMVDPAIEHLTGRKVTSFDEFVKANAAAFRSESQVAR